MKYILLATILALTLTASSPFALGQTAVEAWVQRYDETNAIEATPRTIVVDSMGNRRILATTHKRTSECQRH